MYSRPDSSTSRPPRRCSFAHSLDHSLQAAACTPRARRGLPSPGTGGLWPPTVATSATARHGLHSVAHEPVLITAQLIADVLARPIHERVLEDPAQAGGVRSPVQSSRPPEAATRSWTDTQHAGARPVDVSAVLEDHVDVTESEVGVATNGLDLGRAQQRRDDRVET